jgi:hypothetical protein
MTKALFVWAAFVAAGVVSPSTWADNVPADVPRGFAPELDLRAFVRQGVWTAHLGVKGAWTTDARAERRLLVGAYAQPWRNLRLGAFYQLQYGVRHDEDWVKTDVWHWQDTGDRAEHLLVLDASPRVELAFLPGENWMGELKIRWAYSSFNHQQTLRLRPGLTYFWLREGQAFLSFFAQYEGYFPLNYGEKTLYETWAYLGAIYHVSPIVQLGGYGALRTEFWTSPAAFTATTGRTWRVEADSTVLGLLAIIQLGN